MHVIASDCSAVSEKHRRNGSSGGSAAAAATNSYSRPHPQLNVECMVTLGMMAVISTDLISVLSITNNKTTEYITRSD